MGQSYLSRSIEDATLTVTNGGSGDHTLLKRRDLRVKPISTTIISPALLTVEVEWGSTRAVDSAIIGNYYTSADVTTRLEYWDGAAWQSIATNASATHSNVNLLLSGTNPNVSKYRISVLPDGTATIEIACLFMGRKRDMPNNYQYNNNRKLYQKTYVENDLHGYPYGHQVDTSDKRVWDVTYRLTKSDIENLEERLVTPINGPKWNLRPFFWYDDLIDTNWHLVKIERPEMLDARQIGADYFELDLRLVEL